MHFITVLMSVSCLTFRMATQLLGSKLTVYSQIVSGF